MASILSQYISSLSSTYNFATLKPECRIRKQTIVCCSNNTEPLLCVKSSRTKRREALFQLVSSAAALCFPSIAFGDAEVNQDFREYADEVNKFKLLIPQEWQVGTGQSDGIRSVTAFYPEEAANSNVSVAITLLGADYTKLESFGKVDEFADNLVTGLDRSWQRPPGVKAKLINSKAANGLYYIEYSLENPGDSRRNIVSAIGMASNGWYNRLFTVTGQFVDEEAERYKYKIEKAVSSFRLTKT